MHFKYKNLTNKNVETFRNLGYSEEEIKEVSDRQNKGSQFANTPTSRFFNTYKEGGKVENNWNNFFEKHPEKVLGNYVDTKSKFGKKVKVLKGEQENILDLIETPEYRIDNAKDFGVSESSEQVTENTITFEEAETTEANLVEDEKNLVQVLSAEEDGTLDDSLYTFDEVDKEYNKGITDIEKCAFVKYIEKRTGKPIQGGFTKYKDLFTIQQLFDKGELFFNFDTFELEPKFLFLSGNIADKYGTLQSEGKNIYIEQYGEKAYNLAFQILEEKYKEVQSKYLTLDNPVESLRLKLLLGGKFAATTLVNGYNSFSYRGKEYKSVENGDVKVAGSYTRDGVLKKLNLTKEDFNWNNTHRPQSLTLVQAFFLWLRDAGNPNQAKSRGVVYRNGMSATSIEAIYYRNRPRPKDEPKERWTRTQGYAKANGDRLFAQFLAEGISTEDRRRIEITWNNKYNSTIEYDTAKVPIGFRFTRYFGEGVTNDIRPEKRNAIAYWLMRGSCLFAYGVGIGKTWCSIFTIAQAMELGFTKRPLIIVPKQVYAQFSKEITKILGNQYQVNTLYNLSLNKDKQTGKLFLDKGKEIQDKSISICTYDALDNLGFSDNFNMEFYARISSILNEENENVSQRQKEKAQEKYMEMIGKAKEGGVVEIDSPQTNFDFVAVDEAHNFKKLFTQVKGEVKEEQKSDRISREKHPYSLQGGVQSKMAIKLFFITQYIQSKAKTGNCLLLTATPFTNSPLEIYSMLSFINYNELQRIGFKSLKSFFDTFANMQTQLTINTQLQPVRKQVFIGFNNVVAMQSIIFNMIDKKSREDEDKLVERPNKIVLPFRNIMKNGINYNVAEKNRISTTLSMSEEQSFLADRLKAYAQGKDSMGAGIDFEDLCLGDNMNTTKFGKLKAKQDKLQAKQEKDESDNTLSTSELEKDGEQGKNESAGVRSLQCLTYMRQLALNPYLYACSGYSENPNYLQFVQASPKMLYAFECIKSVLEYEKENGLITSGQVVYMDFGTDAFPLLVEYAIKELGYKENEVGYITGTESKIGKKSQKDKSDVQDAFLGRKFDEELQEYILIDDSDRCKLIFGSSSIREGMNLQFYASTLYNLYIDFNPTDNTQLEGRIWRQGNRFDNVRIVVPLMENSMDIFMFQKLEEKTERINQIWNKDGQTNELNTEDFNPAELKYELITDPKTLAKLEVDDKLKVFEEKIDDKVNELNALRNFESEYNKIDDIESGGKPTYRYTFNSYKPFKWYTMLSALRPDLVPLPFFKEAAYLDGVFTLYYGDYNSYDTLNREQLNNLVSTNNMKDFNLSKLSEADQRDLINYTPKELMEKMVEFNRDKKFSFPPNFVSKDIIEKGDKVIVETRRGDKKGVIEEVLENDKFDIEYDDKSFGEDISLEKVRLQKKKETTNEPFNPFTKNRQKLKQLYEFQSRDEYDNVNKIKEKGEYYTPFLSRYGSKEQFILDPNYSSYLFENWQDFKDNGSQYNSIWNLDIPLTYKKVETAEKNFLKPKGIKDRAELKENIGVLDADINDLEVQAKALNEEENLDEAARLIKEKMDIEAAAGIRKPSTYKGRAEEFASVNSDYYGNEYLLLLSQKELIAKVDTLTDLKKTETYKELSKEDRKKFEERFTKKKSKKKATKKAEPKAKSDVISSLDKRIMALKTTLKVIKNKKQADTIAKRIRALEITKKI